MSIDVDFPVPDCMQTLSEHPNELFYAAGGALPDRGEMSTEVFLVPGIKLCYDWQICCLNDTAHISNILPQDIGLMYAAVVAFLNHSINAGSTCH